MPTIVFINGRFLSQRVTGIQRYAREILNALDALLQNEPAAATGKVEWVLLVPAGIEVPPLKSIVARRVGVLSGHLWEQIELPWHARGGLLVSFCSTGPLLKRLQMITVHDASVYRVPDAFSWRFRIWYRVMIGAVVRRSPKTLVVSRFGASEVVRHFGAEPSKVAVMTEGWQHLVRYEADAKILERHRLKPGAYVLAVSSPTPNKNFGLIVSASKQLLNSGLTLVVAGHADPHVFASAQTDFPDRIKRLGYVSDAELKALYQNALCFVFPSRYEGFGIPPLEAMSCGCPVLVSEIAALQEVCEDAAKYFDPSDHLELARQVEKLASCADTVAGMRARGHDRALQFSWELGARLNLNAILECLNGTS